MSLTFRYDHALAFASCLHRQQTRKGTSIPYISHLVAVSGIVLENGGDEDAAIGALLHDAAEDQGGQPTLDLIQAMYGEAVARIVHDCTDSWTEPKPDWRPRKEVYIASLDRKGEASLLVSLANKTHNARAILATTANLARRCGRASAAAATRSGTTRLSLKPLSGCVRAGWLASSRRRSRS